MIFEHEIGLGDAGFKGAKSAYKILVIWGESIYGYCSPKNWNMTCNFAINDPDRSLVIDTVYSIR